MKCFCCDKEMDFELIEANLFSCNYSLTCTSCDKKLYLSAEVDEYEYHKGGKFINLTSSFEKTKKLYMET